MPARYTKRKRIVAIFIGLLVVLFGTFGVVRIIRALPLYGDASLFVTSWQTDVEGATEPTKVTLNFQKAATDEYQVSWDCSDNFFPFSESKITHDYGEAGTYDVCVRSTVPLRFYSPDLADDEKAKLQEIKQWGTIPWSSFASAFQGMINMQLTASDIPNLLAVTDMSSAFEGATNFTGNSSMNNWVTGSVKNMSSMFKDAANFNSPIGGWNTSQVINMASMFRDARSFNQYIGDWNTSAVTSMSYMFNGATNFNNGEAPGESHNTMNWDTKNVGDMTYMFQGASAFNQKIGDWNTANVGYMSGMFFNATAFNNGEAPGESHNTINWSSAKLQYMIYMFYKAEAFNQPFGDNWNTASVKNMGYAFRDAKSFNQDIGNWNTANVENMAHIFRGASAFNQNLSNWQTGNVTDMSDMFNEATNFNNGDEPGGSSNSLNNWDTSKVKSMFRMFRYASAFNQNLSNWQTGNVTNMSNMFNEATNFNNGEAPGESHNTMNWDTKNVGDMTYMFYKAGAFNQKIGSWDTSNVTGMMGMFMGASSFNQNLNNWDTRKVKSMMHLFNGATVFNNGDVAGGSNIPLNWEIPEVTNMYSAFVARDFNQPFGPKWNTAGVKNMSNMFRQARSFNQYIGDWDTTNVENMSYMFQNANVFNNGAESGDESKPLNWNTAKVTNMACMFNYATVFNQPFGDNWNTAKVTNMARMFDRAPEFNQDISTWDISKVEYFTQFLNASNMQYNNYDSLLNAWSEQTVLQNRTFGAVGVNYCYAGDARSKLMTTDGWNIADAGQNCPPQNIRLSNEKAEVEENTTEVGTISATDETAIIYSLVSGEGSGDNSKFALNPTTGALAFLEPPDYENPTGSADPSDLNKYTIRVRATDATDLYSEKVFIITVLDVDDLPPEINIVAPANKMSNAPIAVSFTVSDRYSVNSVKIADSSVATGSNLSCDPPFPVDNPADPPESEHLVLDCTIDVTSSGKLVLEATDKAGYSSTKSMDGFVIDMTPPVFISSNIDTANGAHNPTVSFEATDAVGMQKYELIYKDINGNLKTDEIEYTMPGVISRELSLYPSELQHTIKVIAYDLVGNTTEIQTIFPPEVTFTANTTISNQPISDTIVKIDTPGENHNITEINLSGPASDGVTLEDCSSYVTPMTCRLDGIHKSGVLTVEAKDANGAIGYGSQMYTIDTVKPNIIISAPTKAKNSNITDTTITVTDDIKIHYEDIEIDPSSAGMVQGFACTPDAGDPNIINCTATITESGNLKINAKDKAGNSFSKTEKDYIVDRDPPVVKITSEAPINKANQTHYLLKGDCTEGDGSIVTIIAEQPYVTVCQTGGTWSTELDLSARPDGVVQVYASQTDAVGNKGEDGKNLTKDTVVPVADFDTLLTKSRSPQLTGLVNDTTATVQVKVAGKTYDADNNGNGTWKLDAGDIDPELANGTYAVSVIATDKALNKGTYDFTGALTIDAAKPVITINPPAKLSNKNIDNIAVTVTDNNGILAEDVSIDSGSTAGPIDLVCTQAGSKKVNCTVAVSKSGKLVIKAIDTAGNIATETEDDFVIDRIAPTVTIDTPVPVTSNNQASYALSGDCTAGDSDLQITVGSQSHTAACGVNSRWTLTTNLSSYDDGQIAVTVKQTDVAGNATTAKVNLTKDTVAPTAGLNNITTNNKSPELTGSVSENTATVMVTIDGNDYPTINNGTGTWTLPAGEIADLADGTYTVVLTVSDAVGNVRTHTFADAVRVDAAALTVTVNQAATQADPTDVNNVRFTVIFSKPLQTDLTKEDLTLTGTTTGSVSTVTKVSGTEYAATVTGLTSGDTVSLSLAANKVQDAAGNFNIASTSTDNSVLYKVQGAPEPPKPPEFEQPKPPIVTPPDTPVLSITPVLQKSIGGTVEQKEAPQASADQSQTSKTPPASQKTTPARLKSLKVKIYDHLHQSVEGATVEIHSDVQVGTTDANGEVYFEDLELGSHKMIISYNGYQAKREIVLTSDKKEEMEIIVRLEPISAPNYVYLLIAIVVLLLILLIRSWRKKTTKKT